MIASREVIDGGPEPRTDDGADGRDCCNESALTRCRYLQFLHGVSQAAVVLDMVRQFARVAVNFALKSAKVAAHVDEQIINIAV